MFCYQCEQAAKGSGCTKSGVCGKKPETAAAQDLLTSELIALAMAAGDNPAPETVDLIAEGLFLTLTNVSFDEARAEEYTAKVKKARTVLGGKGAAPVPNSLFAGERDVVSLRSTLLFGLRGMAAYRYHARMLGRKSEKVDRKLVNALAFLGAEQAADTLLSGILEIGAANLDALALLDKAHTDTFGVPSPVTVSLTVEKGPFIVISGHDLRDIAMLLEQTDGSGVNVYTHCEMLPAHAYPLLKKHGQLKGAFGTAWHNQQKEFDGLPAPILFTTNCLMSPRDSYKDRVYTTGIADFPGAARIEAGSDGRKDFSALINRAKTLGGYTEARHGAGINGGSSVCTGYGGKTLLSQADAIIDAVKSGAIKHFFLVGGCDGGKAERSYYTEFVKRTPQDTVILTLGCGKFRFNDTDIGSIGPFPRILDMGQCNDAYGAIQVALALAGAFNCGVNELPLTLVLSWFEQKAVCILLTLLSLGIKNIYIGPSLPAFLSEGVLNTLVEKFSLHPITNPEQDLKAILQKAG
ncbi:MAG: hydroxylamine reductase [Spirochaetaceae bacterium]|jgi:hydroxylamine reductase|nr:hydroxylamine reductase [Spirochaetaceae bacterium]